MVNGCRAHRQSGTSEVEKWPACVFLLASLAGSVDRPPSAPSMNPPGLQKLPSGSAWGRSDEQLGLAVPSPAPAAQRGASEGPLAPHTWGSSGTPCHRDPLQPFCLAQLSRRSRLPTALINSVD